MFSEEGSQDLSTESNILFCSTLARTTWLAKTRRNSQEPRGEAQLGLPRCPAQQEGQLPQRLRVPRRRSHRQDGRQARQREDHHGGQDHPRDRPEAPLPWHSRRQGVRRHQRRHILHVPASGGHLVRGCVVCVVGVRRFLEGDWEQSNGDGKERFPHSKKLFSTFFSL